jgi:hypothetical protein
LRILILVLFLATASAFADGIAYIGDSQSAEAGNLFSNLQSTLESKGNLVSARAVCSSTIDDYLSSTSVGGRCKYDGVTYLDMSNGKPSFPAGSGETDNVNKLSEKANTVVIQLGDNHLSDPKAGAEAATRLANSISSSGKKCVWIGPAAVPPKIHCELKRKDGSLKIIDKDCSDFVEKKKAVSEAFKSALAKTPCTFIDSYWATEKAPPDSCDCLHYIAGEAGYVKWANAIKSQLATALSHDKPAADSREIMR